MRAKAPVKVTEDDVDAVFEAMRRARMPLTIGQVASRSLVEHEVVESVIRDYLDAEMDHKQKPQTWRLKSDKLKVMP